MRTFLTVMLCCACAALRAQTASYTFSRAAGVPGNPGSTDGYALGVEFTFPRGLAFDALGQLYVADAGNHAIRRLSVSGASTTVAGSSGTFGTVDGTGTSARFNTPGAVAIDAAGNIYVADTDNHAIRLITSAGVVSTLAGLSGSLGSADGTGRLARFNRPSGLVVLPSGELLVADSGNHVLRLVTSSGVVTTFAGSAGNAGAADGSRLLSTFRSPHGLAVAGDGTIYVADTENHTVRRISSAGTVSTLAGLAGTAGVLDGLASAARFRTPRGIAVATDGNIYVVDQGNYLLRRVTSAGQVATLAGTVGPSLAVDGPGNVARFQDPWEIVATPDGALLVSDVPNATVRRVSLSGTVTTFAGTAGRSGRAEGTGAAASFNNPYGIAIDGQRNIIVTDTFNHTIRRISPTGVVSTVAGTANVGGYADGPASSARFYYPFGVAVNSNGDIFVSEAGNHLIRVISAGGTVGTLAGTANAVGWSDGLGANARFFSPSGIALDGAGNVYVADAGNHAIRRVTQAGLVSTVAGLAGRPGFVDGTGADARFQNPYGLAFDSAGNIIVADTANGALRRITPAGAVTTVSGGFSDVPARFNFPYAVAVDSGDNIFVADFGNNVVRRVSPSGVVSTIGGTAGVYGYVDGVGAAARFFDISGIAVAPDGVVFVVDSSNNLIRRGVPEKPPVILVQPVAVDVAAGGVAQFSVVAEGQPAPGYQWLRAGTPIAGATGSLLRLANLQASDAAAYTVVVTNSAGSVTSSSASLTVLAAAPVITTQPAGQAVVRGSALTLSVSVSGSAPFTYRWRKDGVDFPGATSASLTLASMQVTDAGGYDVIVSNAAGSAASAVAVISVVDALPPVITAQPTGQAVASGAAVGLSVVASGTSPLSYWWAKNGVGIPGATRAVLVIDRALTTDAGSYTVTVANRAGTVTSTVATLSVLSAPVFSRQPSSQAVSASQPLTLTSVATGPEPFTYQWFKDGVPLAGGTQATLAIPRVTTTDAGAYTVAVSNSIGKSTSSAATVSVLDSGYGANHSTTTTTYVSGGVVTVSNSFTYGVAPNALGWQVLLPPGWSLIEDGGSVGSIRPKPGQTDLLEWAWAALPASPATFSYSLRVPAGETASRQITALLNVLQADRTLSVLANPDPIVLSSSRTGTHSADSNRDGRISLLELTRVIELYNTRNGSLRTGDYHIRAGTEDGFEPGP